MIILLDLNYTLVENSHEKKIPFTKQIEGETYRKWLIPLLMQHKVILITARPVQHKVQTLQSICDKTGWQPQAAYFNEYKLPPSFAKERLLQDYIFDRHGNNAAEYFAIESNPQTRAMYEKYGIKSAHITDDHPWESLPVA